MNKSLLNISLIAISLAFISATYGAEQMKMGQMKKTAWAQIVKLRGSVTYNGQAVKQSQKIKVSGLLKTGKKSFVKILISQWNNSIVLGPNSEMDMQMGLKPDKKSHSHLYTFKNGICRWVSGKGKKGKGKIKTPNAILGVRGTDFVLQANAVLGESEIVLLDGAVMFSDKNNRANGRLVSKGQWGGLGGRYGKFIAPPLNLPKSVLDEYSKKLNE